MAARSLSVKSKPRLTRTPGVFRQTDDETVVIVTKNEKPMGITVFEGAENTFFVGKLDEGGAAWYTGLIAEGMEIMSVGGKRTSTLSKAAVEAELESSASVPLAVREPISGFAVSVHATTYSNDYNL